MQTIERDAPNSGSRFDFARRAVIDKMLRPNVAAGVEKRNVTRFERIIPQNRVGFMQVAGLAGQREVCEIVGSTGGAGLNVFHSEGEIKDLRGSAAVFAALVGAFGNGGIRAVHDFTTGSACVRAIVASNAASTNRSHSCRSVSVRVSRRLLSSSSRACCASEK